MGSEQAKSRRDIDLQGAQRSKNPSRIQRGLKLRRESSFVHRVIAARSVGSWGNPSRFHSPRNLKRESIFKNAGETKGIGFAKKKRRDL
jgi:hypothetical protein